MHTSLPDNILHPHIDSLSNDAERLRSRVLSQGATILLRNVANYPTLPQCDINCCASIKTSLLKLK